VRDLDTLRQRPVHRAALGDLQQPLFLLLVEVAPEHQLEADGRDLPLGRLPVEPSFDAVERPLLALGIQPNREDRSGAEGRQHQIDGGRARVVAALVPWLVGHQPVRADPYLRLQALEPGDRHLSCHASLLC
jgi:hypothetical protein